MIFSHTHTGSYHASNNLPCEDHVGYTDTAELLCIAIADGVSACTHSLNGARIAVDTVLRLFDKCADIIWKLSNDRICSLVCAEIRYALNCAAESEGIDISEFSSTLAFAVCSRKCGQLLVFSLGDSAVVLFGNGGKVRVPCRPSDVRSEVYTTTTSDVCKSVFISRTDASDVRKVMLLSDGGWYCGSDLIYGKGECESESESDVGDELEKLLCNAVDNSMSSDDCSFISAEL